MIRVDDNNKIYGFSIENASIFAKKNPEIGYALNFIIHPYRAILPS